MLSYLERYGITAEGKKKVEKIFTDIRNKEMLRQFEMQSRPGQQKKNVIINWWNWKPFLIIQPVGFGEESNLKNLFVIKDICGKV